MPKWMPWVLCPLLIGLGLLLGYAGRNNDWTRRIQADYHIYGLDLPEDLSFCGEKVPNEVPEIQERLDRELHSNAYFQSNTLLMIKRANRYWPVITPILKANGIPEDFKYLPLVESGLTDAVSTAGAEGPWQILKATGESYGLEINKEVDERYHLAKATEAACKYLNQAYLKLGSWTLAAASYNMGMAGVGNSLNAQGEKDYYHLWLNTETSRYLPRLLAIKEVMEHPKSYGLHYKRRHLYAPLSGNLLPVDTGIGSLINFAHSQNINYLTLKASNTWLRSNNLPNPKRKMYQILIPTQGRSVFSDSTAPSAVALP